MWRDLYVEPEPATLTPCAIPLDDGQVELLAVPWPVDAQQLAAAVEARPGIVVLLNARGVMFQGVESVHPGNLCAVEVTQDVRATLLRWLGLIPERWFSQDYPDAVDLGFIYADGTRALAMASSLLAAKWSALS
jgi:hypothetical protein